METHNPSRHVELVVLVTEVIVVVEVLSWKIGSAVARPPCHEEICKLTSPVRALAVRIVSMNSEWHCMMHCIWHCVALHDHEAHSERLLWGGDASTEI